MEKGGSVLGPVFIAFNESVCRRHVVGVFGIEFMVVEPFAIPRFFVIKSGVCTECDFRIIACSGKDFGKCLQVGVGVVSQQGLVRKADDSSHDAEQPFYRGIPHAIGVREVTALLG